jgi:YVTN family beta-propeller protein
MRDHPRGRRLSLRAVIALWGLVLLGGVLGAPSAQAQSFAAYITNSGSNTVSVIDTATNMVVATVAVGLFPSGVAVTPEGARVYVANVNSDTVSVIATATDTEEATVAVGTLL